ncbi:MAG: hypothetical protein WCL19_00295 [Verrucomicrobiota bacterium]
MNPHPTETTDIATPPAASPRRIDHGLLFASTAVAALFCYLYITKPVISISSEKLPASVPLTVARPAVIPPTEAPLLPRGDHLPGDDSQNTATEPPPEAKPTTISAP